MVDPLLTPWRVRTYAFAALAALTIAFGVVLAGPLVSAADVPLGGDFVVFYAAGALTAEGQGPAIYDPERVSREQARAVGRDELPRTLAYVYPPCVALAFAPVSRLPYRAALGLTALLLAGLVAGALAWLARALPPLAAQRGAAIAAALVCYPLTRSVAGGQNTAFSLLLISGALALLLQPPTRRRELGAGLLLGLLCYKPNFGLPFLGLCVLLLRPWVLAGGGLGLGALYASSSLVAGPGWPSAWWARVAAWRGAEAARNGADLISLPGVLEQAMGSAGGALGLGLAAVVALGLALLFWQRARTDLAGCWAVATVGVLLLSPHTQFYDAGLLVLPGWLIAARASSTGDARPGRWLAGLFLLSWSHGLTPYLPLQPLFLLVLGCGGLALASALGAGDAPSDADSGAEPAPESS